MLQGRVSNSQQQACVGHKAYLVVQEQELFCKRDKSKSGMSLLLGQVERMAARRDGSARGQIMMERGIE